MNRIAVVLFLVLIRINALQFFYNFMYEAYENLIFVMSPNTQERADITSVKSVVYSYAPTVLSPLVPLLVNWMKLDDMYDICGLEDFSSLREKISATIVGGSTPSVTVESGSKNAEATQDH